LAARRRVGARASAAASAARRKPVGRAAGKGPGRAGTKAAAKAAPPESREVALAIAQVGLDQKALNVEIIDVRGKVDYSDYVVVMAGRSDRHVGGLVRQIEQALERDHGVRCIGVEGMPQATWVLIDYGDVIVHVFHQDTRGYYDLESLWIDAARVAVDAAP